MKIKNQQIMSDGITIIVLGSSVEGEPWFCRVENPSAEADKQPDELYYFNAVMTQGIKGVKPGCYMMKATAAWFETIKAFMDNANGEPFLFEAKRNGTRGATSPSTTGAPSAQDLANVQTWKVLRQSISEVEAELKSRADAKKKEIAESQPGNSSAVKPVEPAKTTQPTPTTQPTTPTPAVPAKRWGAASKAQRDRELDAQMRADIESGKILEIVDGLN